MAAAARHRGTVEPPGFGMSRNESERHTVGYSGIVLPGGIVVVGSEGSSRSRNPASVRISKNLLHVTCYTSSLFRCDGADITRGLFWESVEKLLSHRCEVGAAAFHRSPPFLHARRDDCAHDEELEDDARSLGGERMPGLLLRACLVPLPSFGLMGFGCAEPPAPFDSGELKAAKAASLWTRELPMAKAVPLLPQVNANRIFSMADVANKRIQKLAMKRLPEVPESSEGRWLLARSYSWSAKRFLQHVEACLSLVRQDLGDHLRLQLESSSVIQGMTERLIAFANSFPDLALELSTHIKREMDRHDLRPARSEDDALTLARQVHWSEDRLRDFFNERLQACILPSGKPLEQTLLQTSADYQRFVESWRSLAHRIAAKQRVMRTRVVQQKRETASAGAFMVGAVAGMGALVAAPCAGTAIAATWVGNILMTCFSKDKTDEVGEMYRGMVKDGPLLVKATGVAHHLVLAAHPGLLGARLASAVAGPSEHWVDVEEQYEDFALGPCPARSSE